MEEPVQTYVANNITIEVARLAESIDLYKATNPFNRMMYEEAHKCAYYIRLVEVMSGVMFSTACNHGPQKASLLTSSTPVLGIGN